MGWNDRIGIFTIKCTRCSETYSCFEWELEPDDEGELLELHRCVGSEGKKEFDLRRLSSLDYEVRQQGRLYSMRRK